MMNRIAQLRRSQEGFTLIELLVVVAIIALLATFAVPKLFDAINKSKKAPGQADMQTISGALERFYLDSTTNRYPLAAVEADLKNGFLKAGTTFLNGFKQPYLYATHANGDGYILVDLQGTAYTPGTQTDVDVACKTTATPPVDVDITFTIPANATGMVINAAVPATTNLSTCVAPTDAAIMKN